MQARTDPTACPLRGSLKDNLPSLLWLPLSYCSSPACHDTHSVENISHAFFDSPEVQPVVAWMFDTWMPFVPSLCPYSPLLFFC